MTVKSTQPTTRQPTITQPTITQPTITQPTTRQPNITQPTITQPGDDRTARSPLAHASDSRHESTAGPPPICHRRLVSLTAAVELEVEEDELEFASDEERELWASLRDHFQALVAKVGPVWIADG
ncbi:MAG: hypothetical protein WBM50_06375 [Acidimicrobiales bacterium]